MQHWPRASYHQMSISVLILRVGLGLGTLWATRWPGTVLRYAPWVQLCSGAVFLWAVLGLVGWEVQTLGGTSATERANAWTFRLLNCVGMGALFTSSSALIVVKG